MIEGLVSVLCERVGLTAFFRFTKFKECQTIMYLIAWLDVVLESDMYVHSQ